jgi:MFS superfamily sulfate permease-like transporter
MSVTSLADHGFKIVGEVPRGLPEIGPPGLRAREVDGIVPLAFACFLLAYIEGVSAARTLARKNGYDIDARQELLALGAANLLAAFGQAYPVGGGLSQSTVNDKAGAKTPLALVFASAAIAACLFATGLVRNLPNVVLAAIVLVAVSGLVDVRGLARLRRSSRFEFRIAIAAFVGVLLLGILKGVVLAAILSLLLLIAKAARPHVAFLGRIPGTTRYSGIERNPDNEAIPGALLFRVESGIFYFNVDHVRDTIEARIRESKERPRLVVGDLSMSAYVDVSGARMLARFHEDLAKDGIRLRLVGGHGAVRDILRAEGLEGRVGEVTRFVSLDDVVREFEAGGPGRPS